MWSFEYPVVLLAIPFVVAGWWYLWRRDDGFFYPLAPLLPTTRWARARRWIVPGVLLLSALFLTVALAGPFKGQTVVEEKRLSRYFALVNDVSDSVRSHVDDVIGVSWALSRRYPDDRMDVTLFAERAAVLWSFESNAALYYLTPQGILRPDVSGVDQLGSGTYVDRGLWRSFITMMLRLRRMDTKELGALYRDVLRSPGSQPLMRFLRELEQEESLHGVIVVLVTDQELGKKDFAPVRLLRIMQKMGMRLFVVDIRDGGIVSNDLGKEVAAFAERVWSLPDQLRGGSGVATMDQRLAVVFAELDAVAAAPLVFEIQHRRASRMPHCMTAALLALLVAIIAVFSRRWSSLPI